MMAGTVAPVLAYVDECDIWGLQRNELQSDGVSETLMLQGHQRRIKLLIS